MTPASPEPVRNRLIQDLPRAERSRVLSYCERVELIAGEVLYEPGQIYRDVYFPLDGFISLLTPISGHPALELGLIGPEGVLGATLVLGVPHVPLRAVVQGSGGAWRMTATQLQREMRTDTTLLRGINRYLYVTLAQLAQNAACLRFHEIEARLARWLLMTHDRAHGGRLHHTHQALAGILGVQRSAITIAAGALQRRGLIRYTRGEIELLARKGLEQASCECYEAGIAAYTRRFP